MRKIGKISTKLMMVAAVLSIVGVTGLTAGTAGATPNNSYPKKVSDCRNWRDYGNDFSSRADCNHWVQAHDGHGNGYGGGGGGGGGGGLGGFFTQLFAFLGGFFRQLFAFLGRLF